MDLVDICGQKTAELLKDTFGDEAEQIIENFEIERLLNVPGLGKRKAVNIIRKAYAKEFGEKFQNILVGNSEMVYDKLVALLQSYLVTEQSKNKLLAYFPVRNKRIIQNRQDYFEEAARFYESFKETYAEIVEVLKKISKIREPKVKKYHEYVLITDSNQAWQKMDNPFCDSIFLSTPSEAEYAHSSYHFVIYVKGPDSLLCEYVEEYADRIVEWEGFNPRDVVPDTELDKFLKNEEMIKALNDLFIFIKKEKKFLGSLIEKIELYKNRDRLREKKIDPQDFVDFLKTKEKELNSELSKTIKETEIAIKANGLLDLVSNIGSSEDPFEAIKRSLPPEFDKIYREIMKKIVDKIYQEISIDASVLFPQSFTYPVSLDSEKLYEMQSGLEASDFKSQYKQKLEIASYSRYWKEIDSLIIEAFEIDFKVGMGKFIVDNLCTRPNFADSGVSFLNSRNLFIADASPVSYRIGRTEHGFGTDDRIAVLTGANSGGKTTLLETVLINQILSQMGMFVPAEEFYTTIFEKIRFLAKAKSQNAGAFESTISGFVPIATERGKRLIVIDELESITEPGSAARIISALIDILQENEDAYAVIVTHLGEEIAKLCRVRIDGIEAKGLDDNLHLIVDRQPKFGKIGKSTPELIVEKLYR
ncbi:MAG: MutS-related protein, partial [Candidatus Methanofastidiosia archaeon]